jgi:C-terminal processing protease CtpA/Prc
MMGWHPVHRSGHRASSPHTKALAALIVALVASIALIEGRQTDALDRLVATGKLWATIKYFHPGIDESDPGWWDDQFLRVVPLIESAASRDQYAAALREMIAPLRDWVTRIEDGEVLTSRDLPLGFASVETRGRILIVKSGAVDGDPLETSATVRQALGEVDGVVFDLRDGAPHSWLWDQRLHLPLAHERLAFPAHRFRVHIGNTPPRGAPDVAFLAGLMTRSGPVVDVAPEGRDVRAVFLVNRSDQLPLAAVALQNAGHGFIVAESAIDDRAFARHGMARHFRMPVGDGLEAVVRTSEMVHPDGSVGLVPDVRVEGDGLAIALDVAARGVQRPPRTQGRRLSGEKSPERRYDDSPYPPRPVRALAAVRIWAVFEWLSPYRLLMDGEWDGALRTGLRDLAAAPTAEDYHRAVLRMLARTDDTHSMAFSPIIDAFWGPAAPPVSVRHIEDRPVVTAVWGAAVSAGLAVCDVIVRVDGRPASERLDLLARHLAASTPQSRHRDAADRLLRGASGSTAKVVVERADGVLHEVSLLRDAFGGTPAPAARTPVDRLAGDIGYLDLRQLQNHQVDDAFDALHDTRALIFDMRGYPHGTALRLVSHLTADTRIHGPRAWLPLALDPAGRGVHETPIVFDVHPAARRYRGKSVTLIDERAQSQSEFLAQMLREAHETVFIGSATAGANGNASNFFVPGGIWVVMSGDGIGNRDGTPLQRVGLKPDITVLPTIAGVRAGRDEVLERALAHLASK